MEYVLTEARSRSASAITGVGPCDDAAVARGRGREAAPADAAGGWRFLRQATQNLERQLEYTKLLEMLNSCSDESLRLVLLTTEKFHLVDLAAAVAKVM